MYASPTEFPLCTQDQPTNRALLPSLCQCLDRTNAVEDSLSRFALEGFLRNTRPEWLGVMESATLWASHRTLWADVRIVSSILRSSTRGLKP